jgi:UDP-GlcNAc:undecaprenyl-phosphate/decaprenyl-phosphate GlcNAc-1-phosphate transferase
MLPINLTILYLILLLFTMFISKKFELYDKPNIRKVHTSKVFNTGGIIIYLFYLIVINFLEFNHNIEFIISIGFFVCMVGLIDDIINLNPSTKIILIIAPSAYLIFNGINIMNLGSYDYIGVLDLGKFQIPFLILATGLLINATNYIDGSDGLLLTFFICCLGYYIFLIDDTKTVLLIKLLLLPVVLNLIFNLLPSKSNLKIFSGNSGSLFIGFFISFLTIELYRSFNVHPVYLIWPLWYPVYDFLFVTTNRALQKKNVLSADNSHLHHKILIKFKKNHFKTVFLFLISNLLIIYFGFLISNYSEILSLMTFIFIFFLYFTVRLKFK